ncbi:hypothetical protein [Burkholderia oklahomensis]|uniref:hypothetical protein n=1 Tax=Burkholderia oklahomensis TaxID=342113 RepID=UPI0012F4B1C5|nr:hypothetical protein [Burkholderia oklahomensis]
MIDLQRYGKWGSAPDSASQMNHLITRHVIKLQISSREITSQQPVHHPEIWENTIHNPKNMTFCQKKIMCLLTNPQ